MTSDSNKGKVPAKVSGAVPAVRKPSPLSTFVGGGGPTSPQGLPNASIVYAVAAAILGVIAGFFILGGRWFTGIVVLFPALCFLGYAIHFIRVTRR